MIDVTETGTVIVDEMPITGTKITEEVPLAEVPHVEAPLDAVEVATLKTMALPVSKEAGGVSLLSREVAEEVVERPNMTLTKEE